MSASVLNGLRRELIARLEEDRSQKREILPQAKEDTKAVFPVKELDYHGNVMNKKALEFYRLHGTQVTEPAFEKGQHKGETEVSAAATAFVMRWIFVRNKASCAEKKLSRLR